MNGKFNLLITGFVLFAACVCVAETVGVISDAVIKPQALNSFNPPGGAGSLYTDPAFGTIVRRITDNTGFNRFVLGGYLGNSEICYFNSDGSYFLAADNDKSSGRITACLFNGHTGEPIRAIGHFEPYYIRWALADRYKRNGTHVRFETGTHFYKYDTNELQLWDVNAPGTFVVIRRFSEYEKIGPAGGEGDISHDGRYWVLDGDATEMFVYDLIDDIKYPVSTFDVGSLGSKGSNVGVDYAAISPRGNYIILSWGTEPGAGKRYAGIELYDLNWNFIRQLHPSIVHWESGIDAFGDQVLYTVVTHDCPEVFESCGAVPGDIVSVRLADGFQRLLKRIPLWAHMTISACNSVTNGAYIYLSYQNRSDDPNKLWSPFWDEVIEVPTDGSQEVRRLVHHRSHYVPGQSAKYYQPDAMVNRQGTKLIYRSTYNTGIGDLYMIDIGARGFDTSDTTRPNSPLNLRQGQTTFGSIELLWEKPGPAPDGDYPVFYKILRDNAPVADIYHTRFVDEGLTEGHSYEYCILSVDDAGNESDDAVCATFKTAADVDPPLLFSVLVVKADQIKLTFSEALERSSAEQSANYVIDQHVTVLSASLLEDSQTVLLHTSPMQAGIDYTMTINHVRDTSSQHNVIAPDTKRRFTLPVGFVDDFEDDFSDLWEFRTPERWSLDVVNNSTALFLNTSNYGDNTQKMLGEYAILRNSGTWGDAFRLRCEAKSNEDLLSNRYADYAVVFGFVDDLNYYYVQWHPDDVKVHRIINGERTLFEEYYCQNDLERFVSLSVELNDYLLRVVVDKKEILSIDLSPQGLITGRMGLGSFNDSVWFDNVSVGPYDQGDFMPPAAPTGLEIVKEK
ncbi:hypothetical protein EH223_08160 [candidate division KSB1 bacterium]|nr:Ig-like domain-containing protein [candidate division KSB1 bacterium]RQW04166.1 MAG: hypothetical protein EH223_08160 [candidate division KSB1 bacterium]